MLCSAIGSFRSLNEFRPVLTLETIELLVLADDVDRQAVGVEQAADVLRHLEHDLVDVAGGVDLVGDRCSCFWNSSLLLMSATFWLCGLASNTALMAAILCYRAACMRPSRTQIDAARRWRRQRYVRARFKNRTRVHWSASRGIGSGHLLHFLHGERALARLQVRDEDFALSASAWRAPRPACSGTSAWNAMASSRSALENAVSMIR